MHLNNGTITWLLRAIHFFLSVCRYGGLWYRCLASNYFIYSLFPHLYYRNFKAKIPFANFPKYLQIWEHRKWPQVELSTVTYWPLLPSPPKFHMFNPPILPNRTVGHVTHFIASWGMASDRFDKSNLGRIWWSCWHVIIPAHSISKALGALVFWPHCRWVPSPLAPHKFGWIAFTQPAPRLCL